MSGKLTIDELQIGQACSATFFPNPVDETGFRFRATHLDGRRAPKVVLCDDTRIVVGRPCRVRIAKIEKPDRPDRGKIEVEFLEGPPLQLEGVYVDPAIGRQLQILLEYGINILLDGPQGCGKTTLAKAIAEQLGFYYVYFNCGAVMEASDFLASIQVRAGEQGQPVTDFVKTPMLEALETAEEHPHRRYLVFLDELNRCQESARNALMPALDSTRKIYHPIRNHFLDIPDNVQFVAAVNRGREFSATFGIDAAQLDRFAPLQMDYMPAKNEIELLERQHPELNRALIKRIVGLANDIRSNPELGAGLSVRATHEACLYLKHPLMQEDQMARLGEVLRSSFCGRFTGRWDDPTTDAGAVWQIIKPALQ